MIDDLREADVKLQAPALARFLQHAESPALHPNGQLTVYAKDAQQIAACVRVLFRNKTSFEALKRVNSNMVESYIAIRDANKELLAVAESVNIEQSADGPAGGIWLCIRSGPSIIHSIQLPPILACHATSWQALKEEAVRRAVAARLV